MTELGHTTLVNFNTDRLKNSFVEYRVLFNNFGRQTILNIKANPPTFTRLSRFRYQWMESIYIKSFMISNDRNFLKGNEIKSYVMTSQLVYIRFQILKFATQRLDIYTHN